MTNSRSTRVKRLRSERGAYVFIIAALTVPIMAGTILLGVDSLRIKNARSSLQLAADLACANAATFPMRQSSAYLNFRQSIQSFWDNDPAAKSIDDFRAFMVAPTMSDGGGWNSLLNYDVFEWRDGSEKAPCTSPDKDSTYQDPNQNTSALPCGDKCGFRADLCAPTNVAEEFPAGTWSHVEDAGASVGCILTGQVDTLLYPGVANTLGVSANYGQIKVTSVWTARARKNPTYNEMNPADLDSGNSPTRPLIIAVAPEINVTTSTVLADEVPTNPNRFLYAAADYSGNPGLLDRNNPLQDPTPPAPGFLAGHGFGLGFGQDQPIPALNPVTGTQQQLLVACANPAVLLRQAFSRTLVELAARHGQLRRSTALFHIQPRHIVTIPGSPMLNGAAPFPNPAVALFNFGQDLADASPIQHPYVFYYDDQAFNSHPGGLPFIYPFLNGGNLANQTYSAVVANQLRACYSLYTQSPNNPDPTVGMAPYYLDIDPVLTNTNFEEGGVHPRAGGATHFTPAPSGLWDQTDPGSPLDQFPANLNGNMTPAELLGTIGSVQGCPVNIATGSGVNCAASRPLVPDLLGFVRSLLGNAVLPPELAAVSPGLAFDPTLTGTGYSGLASTAIGTGSNEVHPQFPFNFNLNNYAPVPQAARSAMVILFTHRAPQNNPEIAAINAITRPGGPLGNVLFKIIFIPTNAADAAALQVNNLRTAFNVPPPASQGPNTNEVIILGPGNPPPFMMDAGGTTSVYTGLPESVQFANFWRDSLVPQVREYADPPPGPVTTEMFVVNQAIQFFMTRVLVYGPKL